MHKEHTVAEFIEFCVNGRNDKSGTWTSKGVGKYLEGGKEAGGQLVDQRFCPRIVEGELRYNLVGDSLIGVIHKKPKEGGISAVGGTGSIYTFYGPDEPLFKSLTENFLQKAGHIFREKLYSAIEHTVSSKCHLISTNKCFVSGLWRSGPAPRHALA